jgi:hypothetical protein
MLLVLILAGRLLLLLPLPPLLRLPGCRHRRCGGEVLAGTLPGTQQLPDAASARGHHARAQGRQRGAESAARLVMPVVGLLLPRVRLVRLLPAFALAAALGIDFYRLQLGFRLVGVRERELGSQRRVAIVAAGDKGPRVE